MFEVILTFLLGFIIFYILYKKMPKVQKKEVISWYILAGIWVFGCFYSNIKATGMLHYGAMCLSVLASDMIWSYQEEQKSFVTKVMTFGLIAFFMFIFTMFMQMN